MRNRRFRHDEIIGERKDTLAILCGVSYGSFVGLRSLEGAGGVGHVSGKC